MTALILHGVPPWWTEEHADKATTMLSAAFAEAGHPVEVTPNGKSPTFDALPYEVANRGRSLVYLRLGIDHEWCRECPDAFFTSVEAHDQAHRAGYGHTNGGAE